MDLINGIGIGLCLSFVLLLVYSMTKVKGIILARMRMGHYLNQLQEKTLVEEKFTIEDFEELCEILAEMGFLRGVI